MNEPVRLLFGPKVTRLSSGLTVVTETMPQAKTVAAGVWIRSGSRDEAENEHGLAHFFEHMAFKGTTKRNARQVVEEIEALGGDLNAETQVEFTSYYARLMGQDLPVLLDVLADILLRSVFDKKEILRERDVVLQEIGAYEDDPEELVYDLFLEQAFPGQSIGRPILGTPKSVRSFDGAACRRYVERQYRAPVMVVSAAGAVEHDAVVDLCEKLFAELDTTPPPAVMQARYGGGELRLSRKLEQVHLVLGLNGRSFHHEDHYAFSAFAQALGGGMSSRLFQEVREKRGLAYHVDAFHWPFTDSGIFGIAAGTGEQKAADLLSVVIDEIGKASEELSELELSHAKAQMKVGLMTGFESPSRRAESLARQLLAYGRVLSSDEIVGEIDRLSLDKVRGVGKALSKAAPTLTVIGPVRKVPGIDSLAERLGAPLPPDPVA